MQNFLDRHVPTRVKRRIKRVLRELLRRSMTTNDLLAALHVRDPAAQEAPARFFDVPPPSDETDRGLPIPPLHLRLGYMHDVDAYLRSGREIADLLKKILSEHGIALDRGAAVLDWGGTSGRVLRHFDREAANAEIWGVDLDEPSIVWAKANLSPPFRFLTCTAYPHFPFSSGEFSLVYGISVMTHLMHLRDYWLMEIRRILMPGGLAVLTIHDEETIRLYQSGARPSWIPPAADLEEFLKHDVTLCQGEYWGDTFTFFKRDYVRREWGQYLDVIDFRSLPGSGQTAVVMKKTI